MKSSTISSAYRADIDALRAFAIIFVVLFHFDVPPFDRGGYVGVDIFFVISGYLITKIICTEWKQTGRFNICAFYGRRVARLVPAYATILSLVFLISIFVYPPPYLAEISLSAIFSAFGIPNIYFAKTIGYFDFYSYAKPFLHLWSLGVEFQFYLVWPIILWAAASYFGSRGILLAALLFLFIGVYVNALPIFGLSPPFISGVTDSKSAVFFMTPFRLYEFAIGALAFLAENFRRSRLLNAEAASVAGAIMIGWAAVTYDAQLIYPGFHGLLPTIGTALLIWGRESFVNGVISRQVALLMIGRWSYSIYLVHWPVVSTYKNIFGSVLSPTAQVFLIAFSLAVAFLLYHFVELPFRRGYHTRLKKSARLGLAKFQLLWASPILLLVAAATSAWSSQGWTWRYSAENVSYAALEMEDLNTYVWTRLRARSSGYANNGLRKVLIIGDSQAGDFINTLYDDRDAAAMDITALMTNQCGTIAELPTEFVEMRGKDGKPCMATFGYVEVQKLQAAEFIILAMAWTDNYLEVLPFTINFIRRYNTLAPIYLVEGKQQMKPGLLVLRPFSHLMGKVEKTQMIAPQTQKLNERLRKINDVTTISMLDLFCGHGRCRFFTDEGNPIFYDNVHLSPQGAKFLGERIRESDWYGQIFNRQSR
jgi:peptidoglycan/LPS O-acetylase OafA/YrhL